MSAQFVWFSLSPEDPGPIREFYVSLLGWEIGEEGMVAGDGRPFAAIDGGSAGAGSWVPYVQVDDVDQATERARELGATVLTGKIRGPAGDYATIADPSGAAIALWQPAS